MSFYDPDAPRGSTSFQEALDRAIESQKDDSSYREAIARAMKPVDPETPQTPLVRPTFEVDLPGTQLTWTVKYCRTLPENVRIECHDNGVLRGSVSIDIKVLEAVMGAMQKVGQSMEPKIKLSWYQSPPKYRSGV